MAKLLTINKKMLFVVMGIVLVLSTHNAMAYDLLFHGYAETNLRVRDTDGFQDGFMDSTEFIQQRNTFKFDLDVLPDMIHNFSNNSISLEKIHLTYRGAYDSIFDLRTEEYVGIPHDREGKYNYGKRDIETENDLREAFFDVVYEGSLGNSYLRTGRQLVSWGETSSVVLLDKINPQDYSHELFFSNPDDLKTPVWMARYNHSLPPIRNAAISLDALFIPDVRPTQLAPADASQSAPYAPAPALRGIDLNDSVDDNSPAYGIKLGGTFFQYLDVSLVYYEGINQNGGLDLNLGFIPGIGVVPTSGQFKHPRTETYGGYFSAYIPPVDMVLKGEYARTAEEPVMLGTPDIIGTTLRTWRLSAVDRAMIGIDKNVWARWFSDQQINLGLEYIHTQIQDYDDPGFKGSPNAVKDSGLLTLLINWYWLHGNINPMVFLWWDTEGVYSTRLDVRWNINESYYMKFATQPFWGDEDAQSPYASQIGQSEVSLTFGFQW